MLTEPLPTRYEPVIPGPAPWGRYGHSAEVMISDGCPQYVVLFGGAYGIKAEKTDPAFSLVALASDTWTLGP